MKIQLLLFLLACNLNITAQLELEWGFQIGSPQGDLMGHMFIDDQDNTYLPLTLRDTTDIDPGTGILEYIPSDPNHNYVVSSFDPHGTLRWVGALEFPDSSHFKLVEVSHNRLLVVGVLKGTMRYVLSDAHHDQISSPEWSLAFLEFSLEGHLLRTHFIPSHPTIYVLTAETIEGGDIIMSGYFQDSIRMGASHPVQYGSEQDDAFVSKMNAQFEPYWTRVFGGPGYDYITDLHMVNNTIYCALEFSMSLALEIADSVMVLEVTHISNSAYTLLDKHGDITFVKEYPQGKSFEIKGISTDPDGMVYICGVFETEINFAAQDQEPVIYQDSDGGEGFIARYFPDGQLDWVRVYPNSNYGGFFTLNIFRGKELYVSGGFAAQIDLDPGPGQNLVDNPSQSDGLLMKLTPDGQHVWQYAFPGEGHIGISSVRASPSSDRVFISGFMYKNMDCDPGPDEVWLESEGGSDAFLIAFREDEVISSAQDVSDIKLFAFPNPASNVLCLKSTRKIEEVRLFTSYGALIRVIPVADIDSVQLNVSGLPQGSYLIHVVHPNETVAKTFIKL